MIALDPRAALAFAWRSSAPDIRGPPSCYPRPRFIDLLPAFSRRLVWSSAALDPAWNADGRNAAVHGRDRRANDAKKKASPVPTRAQGRRQQMEETP